MKVYVVIGDDINYGITEVIGVFYNKVDAQNEANRISALNECIDVVVQDFTVKGINYEHLSHLPRN